MIGSFGDQATANLFHGRDSRESRRIPHTIRRVALRKLDMIEAAVELENLNSPPGNRLEALQGWLDGVYSIRVNNRWRIVFRWDQGAAQDVILTDYH